MSPRVGQMIDWEQIKVFRLTPTPRGLYSASLAGPAGLASNPIA